MNSDEDEDEGKGAGDAGGEGDEVRKQRNAAILEKVSRLGAKMQTFKAKRYLSKFEKDRKIRSNRSTLTRFF